MALNLILEPDNIPIPDFLVLVISYPEAEQENLKAAQAHSKRLVAATEMNFGLKQTVICFLNDTIPWCGMWC